MEIKTIKQCLEGKTATDRDCVYTAFPYLVKITKVNGKILLARCFNKDYELIYEKVITAKEHAIIEKGREKNTQYILYENPMESKDWINYSSTYPRIVQILISYK